MAPHLSFRDAVFSQEVEDDEEVFRVWIFKCLSAHTQLSTLIRRTRTEVLQIVHDRPTLSTVVLA